MRFVRPRGLTLKVSSKLGDTFFSFEDAEKLRAIFQLNAKPEGSKKENHVGEIPREFRALMKTQPEG